MRTTVRETLFSNIMLDPNRQREMVFYGRVSTQHEAQLVALENQMKWYEDQMKYHPNWNLVERYIDEGITGTLAAKRPEFVRMLEDAKEGRFDLIVTREVCRFARNTVDTLSITRELKNYGVEVYFVSDNIWTMDGDGELRLSIMATLAQEESRKISERVLAGQAISRENGVLYGTGNIIGYDRIDGKYVINQEQAETIRLIFELYASGMGMTRVANELTARGRLDGAGNKVWNAVKVSRTIRNATYKGYICYNKSRVNNYLEKKRIKNLDEDSFILKKGNFEPIVSEELWDYCNQLRKRKIKEYDLLDGETRRLGYAGMYGTHVSESLRKQFHNGFDAPESPDSAAFPVANLVVMLQIVFLLMLGKEIAEAFGCHGLLRIIAAPQLVNRIEILGSGLCIRFEEEVPLRLHEFHDVVSLFDGSFPVGFGSFADGEVVILGDQPSKTLQGPQKDALCFAAKLLSQKGIILPVLVLIPDGENQLPPEESFAAVIEGFHGAVAEDHESGEQPALVALLTFSFQVQRQLGSDDGFNVVGLGQGLQLHVIIHHHQQMLQIRSGEGTDFHLLNASGIHVVSQQGAHHEANSGLTLAAFAHQEQHLLSLGGRDQAVAHVFLQGGDVLRIQKLIKKRKPLCGCRCAGVVGNRKPVDAEILDGVKFSGEEVCTVGKVDSVCIGRQRFGIAHHPHGVQQIVDLLGNSYGHIGFDPI